MDSFISRSNTISSSLYKKELKKLDIFDLEQLKTILDDRYYNSGEETISDERYDMLCDEIKDRNPSVKFEVGCKLRDGENSTQLPFTLNSMTKIKKGEDKKITKWLLENKAPDYVISDKLNGVSCLLVYSETGEISMYTRGDGKEGANISYFSSKIKGIPKGVTSLNVRGELIIRKADFDQTYSTEYKNSLAMLVSVINSKTLKQAVNHVEFVAYEIVTHDNRKTPFQNLTTLKQLGFQVVCHTKLSGGLTDSLLESLLMDRMQQSIYSIDGIIVQSNKGYDRSNTDAAGNPAYAFAYKIITDSCETEVVDVLWTPSRHGVLKPRVQVKPVELCGVTINFATGNNAKFIHTNKINKGSKVVIIRSGEIIPKIEQVLSQSAEPAMPNSSYSWNETGVDIFLNDEENEDVQIRQLTYFFTTLGIKQIAEGIVRKLFTAGFDTIPKILNMKQSDFKQIPTFETKMSTKLYETIQTRLSQPISTEDMIVASGTFGPGFGTKKLKALLDAIPDLVLNKTVSLDQIEAVNGFSRKTAERVLLGLPKFNDFYNQIKPFLQVSPSEEETECPFTAEEIEATSQLASRLKDVIVVFTNFRDASLESILKDLGATVADSVSKKTTHVVVPDGNTTITGKVSKAHQYGITVVEKSKFCTLLCI